MGFFKDFKDDISQAVNELVPEEMFDDNEVVNTLEDDSEVPADISEELGLNKELLDEFEEDSFDNDIFSTILNQEEETADMITDNGTDDIISTDNVEKEDNDTKISEDIVSDKVATEKSEDVTVITKGTTINGSINSDGSLEIMGTIKGDVECQGKLSIFGVVSGNCMASEVFVGAKRLEGSISSEGSVKIGLGTVVIGDITASAAVIAGAVKGEIDINGPVIVDSSAVIKGNIKAQSVQINNGAVIEGFCSLAYAAIDIDNIFE
ncbi:MAG: hypothetical protein K0R92_2887 [Lachnospiraceae bacterium]|jgi:cytoskeletal protein CcmA (bactofilin family)|nr:hypothetical protein [Lachnospiraceae bacterium]